MTRTPPRLHPAARSTKSGEARSAQALPDDDAPFAATAFFVLFALVIPGVVLTQLEVRGSLANIVIAYAVTAYSAGALALLVWRGAGRMLRLGFHIFIYVFMGLAVFAQVASNTFPLSLTGTGLYSTDEIFRALIRVAIGLAVFELVYILGASRRGADAPLQKEAAAGRHLSETRILLVAAIGLLGTAYLVASVGIQPFFLSRQDAGNAIHGVGAGSTQAVYEAANKAAGGLARYLSKVPILIALFGMLYMRHHRLWRAGSPFREFIAHITFALLIVANLIVNNPLSNSRFWFSTVAITLLSVYIPLHRNRGIRLAAYGAVVTLLFAFTSLQAFRRTGGARNYSAGFTGDITTSGTYSAFTLDMVGERWLHAHDHTIGGQLLGSVFVFVPRNWWPDKPGDTGNLILPIANPAANLWTEGNVEFGIVGIIITFGVLGIAALRLDAKLQNAAPGTLIHAVVPVAGGVLIFFLRGSLFAAVAPAYVLALMFWLSTAKNRRTTSRSSPAGLQRARPTSTTPTSTTDRGARFGTATTTRESGSA